MQIDKRAALMEQTAPELTSELHIPPQLVNILFALLATLALLLCEGMTDPEQSQVRALSLLLLALCALGLALSRWRQVLGRWVTVLSPLLVIAPAHLWMGDTGLLVLAAIPVGLAIALITPSAATGIALGETGLLILAYRFGTVDAETLIVALGALWSMLGLCYAVYRPMHQYAHYAWTYYRQAQDLVEESRDRRAELRQALDDLTHANRQIALANDKTASMRIIAEEAQKTKASFVAKVSHEFRTPLNMIIGLTDLLVETPEVYGDQLPTPLLEDLKIVHRNCEHLSSMVNDVLDLSQAEAGRLTLHREMVDLAEVIDSALVVVQPLLHKKGLDLQVHSSSDLPEVHCDRTRIRQVILNLVSNAARFTEQGGITVRAQEQGNQVVVSVSDTGPGIAEQDAERIFEPFCQAGRYPWRETGGSGLGLSISKQFVELHHGQIWLESQVGIGTTFFFDLPISEPIEPVARPERWISEDWIWRQRSTRAELPDAHYRPRIVVCDPAASLRHTCQRYAEDAEFVEVPSPAYILPALEECPAHAIVLNGNSQEQMNTLVGETLGTVSDTPIIGCAVPPQLERALDAGAQGYLIKPVTRSDLEQAIAQLEMPVQRVLVVDDSPDVLQLFTRMLLTIDETIEVHTASDGEQAIVELESDPPDLLLLDIVMPHMDGWQVLAQKNQDPRFREIPVIFLSAQDPAEQPLENKALLATIGGGLSLSKTLRCAMALSSLMLEPD